MADKANEWIARRAYALWEEEGRPAGRDSEHWHKASDEWTKLSETALAVRQKSTKRVKDASATAVGEGLNKKTDVEALPADEARRRKVRATRGSGRG